MDRKQSNHSKKYLRREYTTLFCSPKKDTTPKWPSQLPRNVPLKLLLVVTQSYFVNINGLQH